MLEFFRRKWFDVGAVLSVVVLKGIFMEINKISDVTLAIWVGFASLLLHQFEEYHWPGYFPQMINKVLYKSKLPDSYPLNPNSAFIMDVGVQWTTFIIAGFLSISAVWLGIAVMLFLFGNFIMHTFYYNIKAKTKYNPGMVTGIVFLMPVSIFYFWALISEHAAGVWDYVIGLPLGLIFIFVNFVKLIDWMKNKNVHFKFRKGATYSSKSTN
ncbi:MAG: HXXEE domain-containing protein [Hydrotalea flava]|uniref:HXXEE domain-containing protein n=2 Tax=Chitinophagaceae TaxID=563835 RepID=UPI000941D2C0|nr:MULTISPECIES: HXXEE domain-containing protein [Hydrotalea]MBY0346739.1 HXXEE domain-containing protein [Hydrotalea flava]RWZ90785.1 MAG: HXXEE domain-containing protein [Hydrotalea sp. AMD]